jgi:hypothetical protein
MLGPYGSALGALALGRTQRLAHLVERCPTLLRRTLEDKHKPSELRLDGARRSHAVLSQIWK